MQYDPPPTPSDYPLEHSPAATTPPPSTSASARSVGPLSYLPPPVARKRRWFAWLWPIAVAALLGAIGGVAFATAIRRPQVDGLADYRPPLVTQVFDRDGEAFTTFARERRVMLKESEMPLILRRAVVASEDRNFLRHGGIDALGIARAQWKNLQEGRIVEGASTITMQLARTLFLTREKKWRRKVEEAFLSVELEKNYSKDQLLALYLNLVNLGHGNYGVEAASRYYFDKPAKELTLAQAATLIGIIPAPSRYSPYRTPDKVLSQRNRVLRRMLEEKFITAKQYDLAAAEPLLVVTQRTEQAVAPYFSEEVRKHLEQKFGATRLYEEGLQVWTTLDPAIQIAAEKGVREGLRRLDHQRGWRGPIKKLETTDLASQTLPTWDASWSEEEPPLERWVQGIVLSSDAQKAEVKIGDKVHRLDREGIRWTGRTSPATVLPAGSVAWFRFTLPPQPKDAKEAKPAILVLEQEPRMEAAAVVIEHHTGAVRAMVGGWDFERNKFNRITQAKRQVGSAFKPFVFGAALENGWTPSDTLLDAPTSFRGADGRLSYQPQNYYKKYYGIVTLRRALEQSINVATVKLMDVVGVRRAIDFAQRCGIDEQLPPYPSLALGSADMTPIELATAFASIANQGTRLDPYWIEKIATRDGQVLERHTPSAQLATEPAVAFVLTHMLEGVVDRGTAAAASKLPIDIAGKTGTTDDYSDAWFVGFTPRYTILTWVGYDVKRSLGSGMTGAVAALPMWITIAEQGLKDGWLGKDEKFPVPPGVSVQKVEYLTGLRSGETAGQTVDEAFVNGTEPIKDYDPKWGTVMTLPWFQQKSFYVPKEGEQTAEPPNAQGGGVGEEGDVGGDVPTPLQTGGPGR